MRFKVATFNIGCGIPIDQLSREDKSIAYEYFVDLINNEQIDIIGFEEFPIIIKGEEPFIEILKERTDLHYVEKYPLSPSHILPECTMGVVRMSRFPVLSTEKMKLKNPEITAMNSKGKVMYSHDKGFIFSRIKVDNMEMVHVTGHCFPFHSFKANEFDYPDHYMPLDHKLKDLSLNNRLVIGADFNTELLEQLLPETWSDCSAAFHEATRPSGRSDDYILYNKGLKLIQSYMLKGNFDHYCCICEFELRDNVL